MFRYSLITLCLLFLAGCIPAHPREDCFSRKKMSEVSFQMYYQGYQQGYRQAVLDCNCVLEVNLPLDK